MNGKEISKLGVGSVKEMNGKEISKELLAKAMACETAEELVALAKENGVEITNEQAQAYLAESANNELDDEQLEKVAGGEDYCFDCGDDRPCGME